LKKDGLCDVKLNIRISCKIWLTWLTTLFTDSPAENKYNRYLQTMLWICWWWICCYDPFRHKLVR